MIGLQDLVIKQNIKIADLAKEIGIHESCIWEWFRNNRVPKKRLKMLAEKFNVEEEYLTKQINDISTYMPRKRGLNNYKVIDEQTTEVYIVNKNGKKFTVLIDTEDLPRLKKVNYSWHTLYDKVLQQYYAKATVYDDPLDKRKHRTLYMHKFILDYEGNHKYIDHKNHDTLDNRKDNLMIVGQKSNSKNRLSPNKNNKSGYRNVFWDSNDQRWLVVLQVDGKAKTFGRFKFEDLDKAGVLAEEMRQKIYSKELTYLDEIS